MHRYLDRPDLPGLMFATVFFCLSLTPSLLPRSWLFQGLVSGVSVAIGYGIGALSGRIRRLVVPRWPNPRVRRRAWTVLLVTGPIAVAWFLWRNAVWQQQIHERLGSGDIARGHVVATVTLTILVTVILVLAARGLLAAVRWVVSFTRRWLPHHLGTVIGTSLALVLIVGILDGVVLQTAFDAADRTFHVVNESTTEGLTAPASPRRSGGPGSLAPWESLGVRGRDFVAGGPTSAEIAAFNGDRAAEPIRVYAGLGTAEEARARAAVAVAELERTGAFRREVLVVMGTTGTGWVNPMAAAALEYLHAGDTALVAMQYSYLPSWLSFLVDQARAAEAGRELFNQVYEAWARLPAGQRPLLLVYGESLGSLSVESAFSGIADLRNRTGGAMLVGPTHFNPLWREFVAHRDPGSPQRLPLFEQGRTVRFAADPSDLDAPGPHWPTPRVVYLQHASDPVVWFTPRLLLRRPDWLTEPRGRDVLPAVRWYPLVTFWQLAADMVQGTAVPAGYGHLYGTSIIDAWAAIAAPPGWTPEQTAALSRHLAPVA